MPTEPVSKPYWATDLGESRFLTVVAREIAPLPRGSRLELTAFAHHAPSGNPPHGCFRREISTAIGKKLEDVGAMPTNAFEAFGKPV